MPKEDRLITFDHQEVYQAVYSLSKQKSIKVPPQGTIENVETAENDPSRIIVDIYDSTEDHRTRQEYSRDFFAAALMLYCRGLGIPLPKSASKSVFLKEGEVGLRVRI